MDVKNIAPFLDAVGEIMPQLGFQTVKRGRISAMNTPKIASLGVMVVIGLTNQLRGNIAYNMTEDAAKQIASKMMMGTPVPVFDAMAESAISELGNMLAANASMIFERQGQLIDISPPTLIAGDSAASVSSSPWRLSIEMLIDGIPLQVSIALAA
jgi:chemotaxis protein CheX